MGKKKVTEAQRWQIIGLLKDKTKSQKEIAQLVGVSEKCVFTTKRNYDTTSSCKELPRSGRPSKLTSRDESYIFRKVRVNPSISYRQLAADFSSKFEKVRVNKDTIRKILLKKKIQSYVAIRKPLLTFQDRLKRLKWCRERQDWTIRDWSKVIFSDESNFEVLNRKSRVFVKRFANEKYHPKFCLPRLQNGGGSVGIWGCINYKGTGCCTIYTGRINQFVYKNTLENELLPSAELFFEEGQDWIFQQDGASAHTAHSIRDWFEEKQITVLPWCPRSPDLNPIENLWSYIDNKLVKIKITSIEHLKTVLFNEWLNVNTEIVKNLIESMPKRIAACIKAKGGHFKC